MNQTSVRDDSGCVTPEGRLEGLRAGGVGVVALKVVALQDGELRFPAAQRLPQQPPAHSGFAEAAPPPNRSLTENASYGVRLRPVCGSPYNRSTSRNGWPAASNARRL